MDLINQFFEGLGLTKEQRGLVMRTGWVAFVSAHILWVCGWLTFVGLAAPFALGQDLSAIAKELRADRLERLQHEIITTRYNQCRTAIDSPSRTSYSNSLDQLFQKYLQLANKEPRVPRCDET